LSEFHSPSCYLSIWCSFVQLTRYQVIDKRRKMKSPF
jgi:hypothetical protein